MKIISCNYTGNIPGIGRGPVTNIKVSDGLYNQLRNMGFAIRITATKVSDKPQISVTKAMHVPSLEEKRAAALAEAKENKTETSKTVISPLKKAEKTKSKPKVEPKVEEVKTEEAPKPEVKEEVQTVESTEQKVDLENLSDEELEAMIPETVKRPVRYGRKWLLKNAAAYV